jgi:hypothetical protein
MNNKIFPTLAIICFFTSACSNPADKVGFNKDYVIKDGFEIKELVYKWNTSTLNSINELKNMCNDSIALIYENRIEALKASWNWNNKTLTYQTSARYKFLEKLRSSFLRSSKFDGTIIELTRSGEEVSLQNYLLFSDESSAQSMILYQYVQNNWLEMKIERNVRLDMQNYLNKNHVNFGIGNNEDDIIVTKFIKGNIIKVNFLLYQTVLDFPLKIY